jgi:hypothetical protein
VEKTKITLSSSFEFLFLWIYHNYTLILHTYIYGRAYRCNSRHTPYVHAIRFLLSFPSGGYSSMAHSQTASCVLFLIAAIDNSLIISSLSFSSCPSLSSVYMYINKKNTKQAPVRSRNNIPDQSRRRPKAENHPNKQKLETPNSLIFSPHFFLPAATDPSFISHPKCLRLHPQAGAIANS